VWLVKLGIFETADVPFLISASLLAIWDVYMTYREIRLAPVDGRMLLIIGHVDILSITSVLIALHSIESPVWAVYFITIVGYAHLISRTQMIEFVGYSNACYAAAAAVIAALGHDVSWAYLVVVSIIMQSMGLNAMAIADAQGRMRQVIARVAVTDSLTGLPNRRLFHETYSDYIEASIEANVPLALMLIDFDHFKEINDRDGHPAGDDKLREVARSLAGALRRDDLVARYGGDEFVVVAPSATRDAALGLAERLRRAAHACDASVSVGLAIFPDDAQSADKLVEAADAALYAAKEAGRNCIRHAQAA